MDLHQVPPVRKWEVRQGETTVHFECTSQELGTFIPKVFPNGGLVHIFKEIDGAYVPFMEMEVVIPPGVKTPDEDTSLGIHQDDLGDWVCRHGTAMDVHCCNCHSGFIFDKDHVCPSEPD